MGRMNPLKMLIMLRCNLHSAGIWKDGAFSVSVLIFHYIFCISFYLYYFFPVLPTIRVRQLDVNATADIGSSALLACDADGFPEPTVTWAQYVVRLLY